LLREYAKRRDRHIEVCYHDRDRESAEDTVRALEKGAADLATYFEVEGPLPLLRAILAPDRAAFDALVAGILRVEIEKPSDPRRIAQSQRTDIVLLSPSAYVAHSTYRHVPGDYRRMIRHELVHVFQEHLSPGIEESPLWWDEGLAVYLSGQWRHPSQFRFREPVLESLRDGRMPTLHAIQVDRSLAYSFGWTLVRFIEQENGKDAVVRIVRQMKDGDVFAALGEDAGALQTAWSAWLGMLPDGGRRASRPRSRTTETSRRIGVAECHPPRALSESAIRSPKRSAMNRQEILDFVRRNPTSFMATVERGQPRVRAMQTPHVDDEGLVFCTGVQKNVSRQLQATDGAVELAYWDAEGNVLLRLRGRMAVVDSLELKKRIVETTFQFLKPVVAQHGYEVLILFRLSSGEYRTWDGQSGGREEAGTF